MQAQHPEGLALAPTLDRPKPPNSSSCINTGLGADIHLIRHKPKSGLRAELNAALSNACSLAAANAGGNIQGIRKGRKILTEGKHSSNFPDKHNSNQSILFRCSKFRVYPVFKLQLFAFRENWGVHGSLTSAREPLSLKSVFRVEYG